MKKIAGAGTVRLLVLLEDFTGWDRSEQWGDTDFFFSHRNDFEKIAVVGNPRWEHRCWRSRARVFAKAR